MNTMSVFVAVRVNGTMCGNAVVRTEQLCCIATQHWYNKLIHFGMLCILGILGNKKEPTRKGEFEFLWFEILWKFKENIVY